MKLQMRINEKYKEVCVYVCGNDSNDEELTTTYDIIKGALEKFLNVYDNEKLIKVPIKAIMRFYSENGHIYASMSEHIYEVKRRLYEIEKEVEHDGFVRISNSEIVNIKAVRKVDTSIAGTIKMYLENDIVTYVSRRNVPKIRKILYEGV